jgi:Uri superfamily endonuclease
MNRIKEWLRYWSRENRLQRKIKRLRSHINKLQHWIEFYDYMQADEEVVCTINYKRKLERELTKYEDLLKSL